MPAGYDRFAAEVPRDRKGRQRNASTNASDQNLHAGVQARLRHHHAPRRQVGQAESGRLNRVAVTHTEDIANGSNESLRKAARTVLSDHKNVALTRNSIWPCRFWLQNRGIQQDSTAEPSRIDSFSN